MKIIEVRVRAKPKLKNIEVVGRVTSKRTQRNVFPKLAKATLQDETGSITLNLWRNQVDQVKVGNLIRVKQAYLKWRGRRMELNTLEDIEILDKNNS